MPSPWDRVLFSDDFGVPIEWKRDDLGSVYIEALDVLPERLDKIRQALPKVRIETAATGPSEVTHAPIQILRSVEGTSLGEISVLEQKFPDPQSRTVFGNAIIEESHTALLRAYALRNLAQQYPVERWRRLSPESQREIAEIEQDHLGALKQLLGRLDNELGPILPGQEETSSLEGTISVEMVLSAVQDVDLLTNVLFAGAHTTLSADDALGRCVLR